MKPAEPIKDTNRETEDWIKKDRPWFEYPVGTNAEAIGGGHWIRVVTGWKWHCGDTFPTPGGDASGRVLLPLDATHREALSPTSPTAGALANDRTEEIKPWATN